MNNSSEYTPWQTVLEKLRHIFESACKDIEKQAIMWEQNPDDPRCESIKKVMDEGKLELKLITVFSGWQTNPAEIKKNNPFNY